MSDIKQEIIFPNSGLNFDDDWNYFASGDAPYRLNILVGEDGANGVITNMLGNSRTVDISDHELILSHTYQVIGSYYNRLTRKVYYFVFSQPYEVTNTSTTTTTGTSTTTDDGTGFVIDYTSGDFLYDNRLLCYNEDTQELDLIFIDTKNYWGLNPAYPMRDITMIGDWLYFNPRISEPKMIDVEMAYNYTNYDAYDSTLAYIYGDYVTYFGGLFRANTGVAVGETPVTTVAKWDRVGNSYQDETLLDYSSEFYYAFNVIKQPPVARPVIAYGTDTDVHSNNIRGKMFRFSYRVKYFDNSYSVYSAYSNVSLPVDDEEWNGEITEEPNSNNFIAVTISLYSPALTKSAEIIFQEIGQSWRRCKIVNRIEQTELLTNNFTYNFYNNEAYETYADPLVVTKIQDSVPKLANAQEIVNKNILCYAGITEGFNNIPKNEIDVVLTPELKDVETIYDISVTRRDNVGGGGADIRTDSTYNEDEGWKYYTIINIASAIGVWGVTDGDAYRIVVNGSEGIVTLTVGDVVDTASLLNAMRNAVHDTSVWTTTVEEDGELWIGSLSQYPEVTVSIFYGPAATTASLTKATGFKTGSFHPFCIFYYDNSLRRWDAQTSKFSEDASDVLNDFSYEGTTVYVPMFNEMSPVVDENHRWVINWEINHKPVDGAKYWRWGYAGNSLSSYFVQYIIEEISTANSMTAINITPLQTLTDAEVGWNSFPQSNISAYTYSKGDRIRFLTSHGDLATGGLGDFVDGVYDYEIIKQSDDGLTIYIQEFNYAAVGIDIGLNSLVEIYTPRKSDSHIEFYEFGPIMPIILDAEGERVHRGITTDQRLSTNTPATGTFDAGDVYHIMRTPSKPLKTGLEKQGVMHESMWWSDFYDSDDWDRGKIGIESNFSERYLNIIRFSNVFLQRTEINGLPTFEAGSYKELNDIYGNIVAIYEIGDTLKVYQERKASSIGIGRSEYMDAEGKITVTGSDQVLGIVRYSPSNYSTVFPESISRNNKFIYGFDIYNGVMWRDSVNGIFPISGRYSEAGMDADYKMATYFKDKSKALLTSGIDHVDVLTVWDEEFKLLYVVFKDYVLETNLETIVFHEPSNRWITFCSLDQTPANGYNVMLELSYDIVKGFEGGLGYWFDEETRFAVFDIITTANVGTDVGADEAVLTLTAYPPTSVTCSAELTPANVEIVLTPYPPSDIHISWVYTEDIGGNMITSLSWDGDESDIGVAETVVIDTSETYVIMTAKPDWLTVRDGLTVINLDDHIDNGTSLSVFPTLNNPGDTRSGSLSFQDIYANERTITVSQGVDTGAYVKMVYIHPLEPTALTFTYNADNTIATSGTTNVQLDITPNHPSYVMFESFNLYWEVQKKVGAVYTSIGTGVMSVYDEYPNVRNLTTTETLTDGMELYIFVSTVGFAT